MSISFEELNNLLLTHFFSLIFAVILLISTYKTYYFERGRESQ